MVFYRGAILPGAVKRICLGPKGERKPFVAINFSRDQHHGFGEVQCFPRVHPNLLDDERGEFLYDLGVDERGVPGKKFFPLDVALTAHQCQQEFVILGLLASNGH